MAKLKLLKSIAYDMAYSFESRNNGSAGIWPLGPLLGHALKSEVSIVELDLRSQTVDPRSNKFSGVFQQYSQMLKDQLIKRSIPESLVISAVIKLTFDTSRTRPSPVSARFTECHFNIEFVLKSDAREYKGNVNGWCFPL